MERNEWESLGEQMGKIVGPCMVRCYYLGYEMAAGNVERQEVNDYLLVATDPIETFLVGTIRIFVEKGRVSGEVGANLVKTMVVQAINTGNEHIILGINNYHKVGR